MQSFFVLKDTGWELSEENLSEGLKNVIQNTGLRGRWERLQTTPKVICDVAHNQAGLKYVLKQLLEEKHENLHLVLGVVNDKDLTSILPLFPKNASYYFCRPDIPARTHARPRPRLLGDVRTDEQRAPGS